MKKTLLLSIIMAAHAGATTILIDFGPTATTGQPATWNNFNPSTTGASSTSLFDTSNGATGSSP